MCGFALPVSSQEPEVDQAALTELKSSWKQLREKYQNFRAEITDHAVAKGKQVTLKVVVKSRGEQHATEDTTYLRHDFQPRSLNTRKVRGQNSSYHFALSGRSEPGSFQLEKYVQSGSLESSTEENPRTLTSDYIYPLRAGATPVDTLVENCEIVSLQRHDIDSDKKLWQLELRTRDISSAPPDALTIASSKFILDADNDWSIVNYSLKYVGEDSVDGTKTYLRQGSDSLPGVETRGKESHGRTVSFDKFEFTEVPYEEFELAYYGLTPPSGSTWRRFAALTGAFVLLAVGFYLTYRARSVS